LNDDFKKIFEKTPIIELETIKKLRSKVSKKEIKKIITKKAYDYE